MVDPRSTVGVAFYDVSKQLVGTLSEAWPDRFSMDLIWPQDQYLDMMKAFVKNFSHLFEKASRHDIAIFDDELLSKYKDLALSSPDTLVIFWQYTDNLVRYATVEKMYTGIPTSIMGVITESIGTVKDSLEKGTLDPKFMNPLELGQEVMNKLRPEDLAALTETLMNNQEEMMGMMSSMMNLMNNLK